MVPLLERLEATITPKAADVIGTALGIDAPQAQKSFRIIGPTLLGVLAKTAATPEGVASIMGKLAQSADPGELMGRAMKTLGGGGGLSSEGVGNMLGSGTNAISSTLSRNLGFDVTPLLGLGTALFTGVLANLAKSGNLDASGVAAMLQRESTEFMSDPASKGVARVVQAALQAGDAAAALRKAFSDADWAKIKNAPIAVTYLIVAADPKGAGAVQEVGAAAGALVESIKAAAPTSLMGAVFACGMSMHELEHFKKGAPNREGILAMIRDTVIAVRSNDPADAEAYCRMLLHVAQKAAEAAKEGGFLGIGGKWVSDAEEKALADIRAILS